MTLSDVKIHIHFNLSHKIQPTQENFYQWQQQTARGKKRDCQVLDFILFLKDLFAFLLQLNDQSKRDHSVCEWKNHSDFIFLDFNRALDSFTFFFY